MIINIPDKYTNTFSLLGERIDLLQEEASIIDMLTEEQEEHFNPFLIDLKIWMCQMLETAFMEGAKAGAQACRKADENDHQIIFKF